MLAFVYTRNIESLSARRNVRFASFTTLIILSLVYWNTGEMLNQKIYAMDIAYHMILPVFTVTVVAFAGTALLTRTTMMEVMKDDFILTATDTTGYSLAAGAGLLPVIRKVTSAWSGNIFGEITIKFQY